jgi:HAD superfamily hydrolase (TIGR01549 family)
MVLKAVLFDLHGTLGYVKDPTNSQYVSQFLLKRGYEVYPQSLDAARHFVSMVDYPRYGYRSWHEYLQQVMCRLDVEIDAETLEKLAALHERRDTYALFPDATPAVRKTKELSLKTAIVTTIARFTFQQAIAPLQRYFDTVTTGYEARCEKSNPRMHKHTLRTLGVSAGEAVMIGDEPLVDIKVPKKLGMQTIFLDRNNKVPTKPRQADAKVSTLTQAINMLEKWQVLKKRCCRGC